jgi:poly(A) polymerase
MAKLNQEGFKGLPGEALAALVRDYLEDTIDWKAALKAAESPVKPSLEKQSGEDIKPPVNYYKDAFLTARQFVLPMNPPRMELDHAVRLIFGEQGIAVKRSRFPERPRRPNGPRPEGESPADAVKRGGRELSLGRGGQGAPSEGEAPKQHRKRRRHKPAAQDDGSGTASSAPVKAEPLSVEKQ